MSVKAILTEQQKSYTKAEEDALLANYYNKDYIDTYMAPLDTPTFIGVPKAPTAAAGANTTQIATTAFVEQAKNTRVPVYGKGVNLLRNWYFVGGGTGRGVFPVNSRGESSYATNGYTIDGWSFSAGGYVQTLLSSGLQLTGNRNQYYLFNQRISDAIAGKTVTIAIWSSYGLDKRTLVVADGNGYSIGDYFSVDISINTTSHYIYLGFKSTESTGTSLNIVFYAVKLELGTEQTLCHNEGTEASPVWVLNEMPDYEYELYRCITSTADSNDTYANKTLATGQEIAYVENGTTASRNYTAGQYISWHGLLYTANQAISSGATLSAGTGGNLTECVGGGFNNLGGYVQINSSEATVRYAKIGKMVVVTAYGTYVSDNRVVLGNIPDPVVTQFAIVYRNSNSGSYGNAILFQENGTYKLSFYGATPPTNTPFVCSFSYISI